MSSPPGLRILSPNASAEVVLKGPAAAPPMPEPGATPDVDVVAEYRRGRADERQACRAELDALREQAARYADAMPAMLSRWLDERGAELRVEVCDLALHLAGVLLRNGVPREDLVRAALAESLNHLMPGEQCDVHVHPVDLEALQAQGDAPLPAGAQWTADPSLNPGDVVVHTRRGLLDGTLESRTAALADTLRTALAAGEEPA